MSAMITTRRAVDILHDCIRWGKVNLYKNFDEFITDEPMVMGAGDKLTISWSITAENLLAIMNDPNDIDGHISVIQLAIVKEKDIYNG